MFSESQKMNKQIDYLKSLSTQNDEFQRKLNIVCGTSIAPLSRVKIANHVDDVLDLLRAFGQNLFSCEESPSDQRIGDVVERLVNLCQSIPANPQPAELLQPADRSFDRPASGSQRRVLQVASLGDECFYASQPQKITCRLTVVAFVGSHASGSVQRTPPLPADLGKLQKHQRQQLSQVMDIGGRQDVRQRNSIASGHQVRLAAAATTICRIRAGFCPPSGALINPASMSTSASSRRPAAFSCVRRWR